MVVMKIKCAKYANMEMNGIKTSFADDCIVLLFKAIFTA